MNNLPIRVKVVLQNAGISRLLAVHLPKEEYMKFKNAGRISWEYLVGEKSLSN